MFVLGEAWCRAENEGAGWSVGLARGGRLDISACRTPREASRQAQRRGGFCKSLNNLYSPTQRLLSKRREGRKYIKQFEKLPKTPAMRILECPDIDERHKNQVRLMLAQNDPISLRNTIEMKKRELLKLDYKIANQNKTELTCDISSGRARGPSQKHEASPPKGPPKKARAWCHPL